MSLLKKHGIIERNATGVQHVHAGDIDGDGDIDIVSAAEHENTIAWYQNNGAIVFSC